MRAHVTRPEPSEPSASLFCLPARHSGTTLRDGCCSWLSPWGAHCADPSCCPLPTMPWSPNPHFPRAAPSPVSSMAGHSAPTPRRTPVMGDWLRNAVSLAVSLESGLQSEVSFSPAHLVSFQGYQLQFCRLSSHSPAPSLPCLVPPRPLHMLRLWSPCDYIWTQGL